MSPASPTKRVPTTDSPEAGTYHKLSPRLQQILCLIADGKSTKEIAANLEISKKTVEFHRRRLSRALEIQSTALLTRFAVRAGAVPP